MWLSILVSVFIVVMGLEIGLTQLEAQFMGYGCVYINNLNPHVLG